MLRPDDQLERPYLVSLMVHHWIDIQRHGKRGGFLTCGSYITLIASHLGVDLSGDHQCTPPLTVDLQSLRRFGWIQIHKGPPRRTMWITETEGSFQLPVQCPIVFGDVSTYQLRPQPMPQQAQGDIPMEEAAPADPPSPYHDIPQQPQHMPPHEVPTDWSWPQFYSILTGMQQVQLETRDSVRSMQSEQERQRQTLLDIRTQVGSIDTRMASLEVEFTSWGSYHAREDPGAGPSGPSDPSA
jgi:hypothetical protein